MSSPTKLLSSIGKLCVLGLASHQLIPSIISLFEEHLKASAGVYFWLDESGNVCDIYDSYSEAYNYMPLYLTEFKGKSEREVFDGFAQWGKSHSVLDDNQLWRVDRLKLLKHPFYNEFLAKTGYYWAIQSVIHIDHRCHGILQLKRTKGMAAFTNNDKCMLANAIGYVKHSLSSSCLVEEGSNHPFEERGFILLDSKFKIQHISENAIYLSTLCDSENSFKKMGLIRQAMHNKRLVRRLLLDFGMIIFWSEQNWLNRSWA